MLVNLKPFTLFLACSVVAIVVTASAGVTQPWFLAALCAAILIAGLPHGAFDYYIISARYSGAALPGALCLYVALIGLTVVAWWAFPLLFLAGFLTYSAFHFGDSDWPDHWFGYQWAWGACIVGFPCLLDPAAVNALFTMITGIQEVSTLTTVAGLIAIPGFILCCHPLRGLRARPEQQSSTHPWTLKPSLMLCYIAVCLIGGPLTAFACYFAGLHSPFHLARWRQRIKRSTPWGIHVLSAIVLVSLGLLAWFFPVSWQGDLTLSVDGTAVRYTFLALAALTVPHMTLLFLTSRQVTDS